MERYNVLNFVLLSIHTIFKRMRKSLFIVAIGVFILSSCQMNDSMQINIKEKMLLSQIPSASGVEYLNEKFWIIGDDSPWLFELDKKLNLQNRYAIFSQNKLLNNILPKKDKPDFEAITSIVWDGDSALFIFGSGSKSPERDKGVLVKIKKNLKSNKYDLSKFYKLLRQKVKLSEDEFNIEAAVIYAENLILFNRGKNKIILLRVSDFKDYITGINEKIKIKSFSIDLPEINGVRAGFSGATADLKNKRIVFTASVENTSNWIDDGERMGSFIGLIDITKLHQHYVPKTEIIKENNEVLPIKVESISITHSVKNKFNCIVVTDNDGGVSEIFKLEVNL